MYLGSTSGSMSHVLVLYLKYGMNFDHDVLSVFVSNRPITASDCYMRGQQLPAGQVDKRQRAG